MKRWMAGMAAAACGAAVGGELFVANDAGNRRDIEVYAGTDSGNAYPRRVLAGPASLLDWPWAVAVDAQHLYVANYTPSTDHAITVYRLSDHGTNVSPARTISCPAATLCKAIAADAGGIVVGTAGSGILSFAPDASGPSAPRTHVRPGAGLSDLGGMAADAEYIYAGLHTTTGAIHVYRRADDGEAAPLRVLRGPAVPLRYVGALAVDGRHLYVLNDPGTTTNCSILVYDKGAAGETPPLRRIAGPRTGLSSPLGIAVDEAFVYVTSRDRNCIQAFPILADGDTAPTRVIRTEYPNPYLFAPHGLAVRPDASPLTARAGPIITADGIRTRVTVMHPAPVTLAIGARGAQFAGIPVDWFAVCAPDRGGTWYCLQPDGTWPGVPAGDLAACRPALQAPLADARPVPVLTRVTLPVGVYTVYAIADYPMDGLLNLLPGRYLYDTVRVEVLAGW